jgi:hypothetical protein
MGFTGCGKTLPSCHSDPALREKNLALSIFKTMRDPPSLAAPQDDSPGEFFRSLFSPAVPALVRNCGRWAGRAEKL